MSAHLSLDELRTWILDGEPEAPIHVQGCERCRNSYRFVVELCRLAARPLPAVPTKSKNQLRRIPRTITPAPALGSPRRLRWTPADVRGSALASAPRGHILTQSSPEAEVSVVARPPGEDGHWHFDGRVWLHGAVERPVQVVLTQDDHVLSTIGLHDGGHFRLSDVVGRDWTLEIHLPSGRILTIGDPGP